MYVTCHRCGVVLQGTPYGTIYTFQFQHVDLKVGKLQRVDCKLLPAFIHVLSSALPSHGDPHVS